MRVALRSRGRVEAGVAQWALRVKRADPDASSPIRRRSSRYRLEVRGCEVGIVLGIVIAVGEADQRLARTAPQDAAGDERLGSSLCPRSPRPSTVSLRSSCSRPTTSSARPASRRFIARPVYTMSVSPGSGTVTPGKPRDSRSCRNTSCARGSPCTSTTCRSGPARGSPRRTRAARFDRRAR